MSRTRDKLSPSLCWFFYLRSEFIPHYYTSATGSLVWVYTGKGRGLSCPVAMETTPALPDPGLSLDWSNPGLSSALGLVPGLVSGLTLVSPQLWGWSSLTPRLRSGLVSGLTLVSPQAKSGLSSGLCLVSAVSGLTPVSLSSGLGLVLVEFEYEYEGRTGLGPDPSRRALRAPECVGESESAPSTSGQIRERAAPCARPLPRDHAPARQHRHTHGSTAHTHGSTPHAQQPRPQPTQAPPPSPPVPSLPKSLEEPPRRRYRGDAQDYKRDYKHGRRAPSRSGISHAHVSRHQPIPVETPRARPLSPSPGNGQSGAAAQTSTNLTLKLKQNSFQLKQFVRSLSDVCSSQSSMSKPQQQTTNQKSLPEEPSESEEEEPGALPEPRPHERRPAHSRQSPATTISPPHHEPRPHENSSHIYESIQGPQHRPGRSDWTREHAQTGMESEAPPPAQ
ncbi:hypothetical protein WMY93_009471 [Mugilogobius chulae]|uniref:Uncharacterized protein n=1 Tax=Mugilogobius chulae TaxID=88201 RepID=A0AAW0PI24_9GOBI